MVKFYQETQLKHTKKPNLNEKIRLLYDFKSKIRLT